MCAHGVEVYLTVTLDYCSAFMVATLLTLKYTVNLVVIVGNPPFLLTLRFEFQDLMFAVI